MEWLDWKAYSILLITGYGFLSLLYWRMSIRSARTWYRYGRADALEDATEAVIASFAESGDGEITQALRDRLAEIRKRREADQTTTPQWLRQGHGELERNEG